MELAKVSFGDQRGGDEFTKSIPWAIEAAGKEKFEARIQAGTNGGGEGGGGGCVYGRRLNEKGRRREGG